MGEHYYGDITFPAWALRIPDVRDAVKDHTSEPSDPNLVRYSDDQASYGMLEDVEEVLEDFEVPFDACADSYCEFESVSKRVRYSNGEPIRQELCDPSSFCLDVREVQAMLNDGTLQAKLDKVIADTTPLAPELRDIPAPSDLADLIRDLG